MSAADTSLAGQVNTIIAAVLRVPDSLVKPHARLREDLHAGPTDLMRLAYWIEAELGIEPVMFGKKPEDGWVHVSDVLAHYAGRP